jgi:hypothetical protein
MNAMKRVVNLVDSMERACIISKGRIIMTPNVRKAKVLDECQRTFTEHYRVCG